MKAKEVRKLALEASKKEIDDALLLIDEAATKGKMFITLPDISYAVVAYLEENEFDVSTVYGINESNITVIKW